jgi:hypothetical protein
LPVFRNELEEFHYRAIKQILKDGLDQQPELLDAGVLEAPYLSGGRFCRSPTDLLH